MLSKLFADIKVSSGAMLFGFVVLVLCGHFLLEVSIETDTIVPLGISFLTSSVILIGVVFGLTEILDVQFHITRKNLYAGLLVVLVWGCVPSVFTLKTALFIYLFIMLQYNLGKVNQYSRGVNYPYLINSGLLAFLAFVLTPVGWVFFPIILLNNVLFAKASFREIFIPIYTFVFAGVIMLGVSYIYDKPSFILELLTRPLFKGIEPTSFTDFKYRFIFTLLLLLVSMKEYFVAMTKAPIIKRKSMSLFLFQALFFLVSSFFWVADSGIAIGAAMLMTTILFANQLQYTKKYWVREVWLWLIIGFNVFLFLLN